MHMEVCLPIEVEGKFGEFYPGVINGLNSLEEFRINLLDSTQSKPMLELTLPSTSLRLPPQALGVPFEPTQGQEVDVLVGNSPNDHSIETENSEENPIGKLVAWWPGRVKRVGGGFVIVELCADFATDGSSQITTSEVTVLPSGRLFVPHASTLEKTDIFEKNQLRPRSIRQKLNPSSFHVHKIAIPDQLAPYCKEPAHYHHFARTCGLPVLICLAPDCMKTSFTKKDDDETYDLGAELLVISTDSATVHRASVIDNTFIEMLRQKVQILEQTEELTKKLKASQLTQVSPIVDEFSIAPDMVLYAIGDQRSNIKKATDIDGIINIKLDRHTGNIRIMGKTLDAVKYARELLDFSQEFIYIPRSYVGPILGSGHRHLQHIVDRVGLVGIKILKSSETEQQHVTFQLTGTRSSIHDAELFLEFQIATLQELDRLRGIEEPPSIIRPKDTEELVKVPSTEEAPSSQPAKTGRKSHKGTHQGNASGIQNGDHPQAAADTTPIGTETVNHSNPGNSIQRSRHSESRFATNTNPTFRQDPRPNNHFQNAEQTQGHRTKDHFNHNLNSKRSHSAVDHDQCQTKSIDSNRQNISVLTAS